MGLTIEKIRLFHGTPKSLTLEDLEYYSHFRGKGIYFTDLFEWAEVFAFGGHTIVVEAENLNLFSDQPGKYYSRKEVNKVTDEICGVNWSNFTKREFDALRGLGYDGKVYSYDDSVLEIVMIDKTKLTQVDSIKF